MYSVSTCISIFVVRVLCVMHVRTFSKSNLFIHDQKCPTSFDFDSKCQMKWLTMHVTAGMPNVKLPTYM